MCVCVRVCVCVCVCRMNDQLLEVVGLYSSLHVGKIQVSLGEALRMGQAKEIKVGHPGERERGEETQRCYSYSIPTYIRALTFTHAHTLTQIEIHESVPVQVDGEPWQQGPATITISHHGQAHMLKKIKHD